MIFAGQGASQELVATERLGWAPGYGDEEVADAMASAAAVGDAERRETAQHVVADRGQRLALGGRERGQPPPSRLPASAGEPAPGSAPAWARIGARIGYRRLADAMAETARPAACPSP